MKVHKALQDIQPFGVARHFDAIRKIPHASGNEAGIRRYLKKWADRRRFTVRTDDAGNIAIDIPSPVNAGSRRVLLQAHMDMVCVKRPGVRHDFKKDPIDLEKRGDRIHSKGRKTTLGADNGLGLAMALAIAEDTSLERPHLTILATVNEERGMTGALELGRKMIPRRITDYINLDSEEGPEWICCGSAGVVSLRARWPLADYFIKPDKELQSFLIQLKGLWGGHSGIDIHKGRGNAILFLKDLVKKIRKRFLECELGDFHGGQAGNAIPPAAHSIVFLKEKRQEELEKIAQQFEKFLKSKLGPRKGARLKIKVKKVSLKDKDRYFWSRYIVDHFLKALDRLPDGPIKKSDKDHVTVSNNVGMVGGDEEYLRLVCFSRYAPHEERAHQKMLKHIIASLEKEGAVIKKHSDIGWKEPASSRLVRLAKTVGASQGRTVRTFAYHAGLEVGVIRERLRYFGYNVDAISSIALGPVINEGHSTHENFEASSIWPTYNLLKGILEKLAECYTKIC